MYMKNVVIILYFLYCIKKIVNIVFIINIMIGLIVFLIIRGILFNFVFLVFKIKEI